MPPAFSLVVPTFNERKNLAELVRRVDAALGGVAFEIVFVDDNSPDGTAEAAKDLARTDPRVRCIRRIDRRGLAGACIEGFLSSAAPVVGVMDGDLQHDETLLPRLYEAVRSGAADIAIGSRHVEDGSADAGFSLARQRTSNLGTRMAQHVLGVAVSDPMSGFFVMRRDLFDALAPHLSSDGFKILADILATADPKPRIAEFGYRFRERTEGESKFDLRVGLDFLGLMLNKLTGGLLPTRFVLFAIAGASGLLVHMLVLRLTLGLAPESFGFARAQALATVIAMTSNFFVNNLTTYRDARLSGLKILRGLLAFYAVCSLGAFANVGVAAWVYVADSRWWVAGFVGALMGSVWNYALSNIFVWRKT